jgi:hypothetical protein
MTERTELEILAARRNELFAPIHQQILMTDDNIDIVLLATNMLTSALHIYVSQYGFKAANSLITETVRMYGEIHGND